MRKSSGYRCNFKQPCYCVENICVVGGNCLSGNAFIDGKPICDDLWDMTDANVFCKTLGFYGAKVATSNSR